MWITLGRSPGYNTHMFIGAILIGLLTAYYLGIKPGVIAAASSFMLFVVAEVAPPAALYMYGVVAIYIVGLCLLGPRVVKPDEESGARKVRRMARQALGKLWKWL